MKAIILAAGYGNRMRPLTDHIHKTLLKVGNETIIERIINGLVANDVYDIVVVTGYKASDLETYLLKNFNELNFQFIENTRYRETNNIYSLALAFDSVEFDQDILVIESDLIYDASIISRIINSPYDNVALVDKYRSGMDGTVVTLAGDVITNVIPPHLQGENFTFADKFKTLNIYKFSKDFCNLKYKKLLTYYAKVIDDNCYYELILGILIYMQQETIYAEVVYNETWAEVDDVNDLRIAEYVFNPNKQKKILEESWGGYWNYDITDFCFIRNMYFPTHAMIAEVKNNFTNLIHNYGSKNSIVDHKLSNFLLVNEKNLIALNGASQLYPFIKQKFGNQKVLMPAPTFGEYERIFEQKEYYSDKPGTNWSEIEKKIVSCDIVIFVNPNNPTGTILETSQIINIAKKNPTKTIIVDESFLEFSTQPSVISTLEKELINNILVLTSMSKSFGFPGLRLGYCYSTNLKLNEEIKNWLPIWNFNSFAEFILEIILKHRLSFAQSITKTNDDRNEFAALLSSCKSVSQVYSSDANFLLVKFSPMNEMKFCDWLLNHHKIFVKSVTDKFNDQNSYFRFAVRTPEENQQLVNLISLYFNDGETIMSCCSKGTTECICS